MTVELLASIPSPPQGVWHLGPFPIRAYALCIIAGIIAALVIGNRRWVARGGENGIIYDIALWAVPFGLVGGRLYHVLTDWSTYFGDNGLGFLAALRIWDGGLGIWGAVALGAIGAWIACRINGIPLPAFGDAIAPGIVLAQAIGRLGNYFNQELYGHATTMPWGLIIYQRENAAGQIDRLNGVSTGVPELPQPVHPTFLYELLWNLLVFAVLIWADRRFKIGHGRLFALYVAGYCLGRFWIELMRSDYATLIAGIRVNTFTSTFVFIGAVIYIMAAPKGREAPETLRGKRAEEAEADSEVDAVDTAPATVAVAAATAGAASGASEDSTGPPEEGSEAAAEAVELADDVEEASSEDIAEAEEFAAAGETSSDSEGLGSVEPDEVAEAVVEAPEVHETEAEAAEEADTMAEDVAEAEDGAEPAESESTPEPEPEAEPDGGVGAVEPGEVAEAVAEAPEVHETEVEAAEEADTMAEDVAESEAEPAEAETTPESEPEAEAEAEAEPATDTTPEPEAEGQPDGGVGSVEPDEVADAVAEAPEVHDTEVEAAEEADTVAEDVAESEAEPTEADTTPESEPEAEAESEPAADTTPESEPDDGIGSVEPDEVAEAVAEAPEIHDTEAEAAEEAEDVAAEAEPAPKSEPQAVRDTGARRRRWWRRG